MGFDVGAALGNRTPDLRITRGTLSGFASRYLHRCHTRGATTAPKALGCSGHRFHDPFHAPSGPLPARGGAGLQPHAPGNEPAAIPAEVLVVTTARKRHSRATQV